MSKNVTKIHLPITHFWILTTKSWKSETWTPCNIVQLIPCNPPVEPLPSSVATLYRKHLPSKTHFFITSDALCSVLTQNVTQSSPNLITTRKFNINLRQFCSSELSRQSSKPSHHLGFIMHLPLAHVKSLDGQVVTSKDKKLTPKLESNGMLR